MAGGIVEVAAEEAERASLPTPSSDNAEATTVPISPAAETRAGTAPPMPFTR